MRTLICFVLAAAALALGLAAYVYVTLPDVSPLASTNPVTTAFIESRADEARARHAEPTRDQRYVPYGQIAETLKRAVLVAEQEGFWRPAATGGDQNRKSPERDLQRRALNRDGSTIARQLARNLYLARSKSPFRRLRELLIARRLEASLTRTRIFELYLNVIEWGDGVYGAEAAAETYFGKPASALAAEQAALLAACLVNPRVSNPAHDTPGLLRRQKLILARMSAVTPPPDVIAPAPAR